MAQKRVFHHGAERGRKIDSKAEFDSFLKKTFSKGKNGDATELVAAENARLIAAKIRTEASLDELAGEVRIISGMYDLGTGKVEWAKE